MLHRQTPRAQRYDYTSGGGYFITICTAGRQHYFGDVCCRDDTSGRPPYMQLNDLGNIVDQYLLSIPDHFPHVEIHEYVVMPNHVHILLIMSELRDERRDDPPGRPLNTNDENNDTRTTQCIVPTADNPGKHKPKLGISPKPGSLSAIIGSFKSICTREINKQSTEGKIQNPYGDTFARQPRYHDHIIRNQDSYNKIMYYIQTNPQNRENDSFNK